MEAAQRALEDYVNVHEGEVLGVYAMDMTGLAWWEIAKCAQEPEKKILAYDKAIEWFTACLDTDNVDADTLTVITNGYYHLAQASLSAGRQPGRNYFKEGIERLSEMLERQKTAWRTDNGLRAMIEWGHLEAANGNIPKAIQITKDAAEKAKIVGKTYIENIANRRDFTWYVEGKGGGDDAPSADVNVDVLRRVAEDDDRERPPHDGDPHRRRRLRQRRRAAAHRPFAGEVIRREFLARYQLPDHGLDHRGGDRPERPLPRHVRGSSSRWRARSSRCPRSRSRATPSATLSTGCAPGAGGAAAR